MLLLCSHLRLFLWQVAAYFFLAIQGAANRGYATINLVYPVSKTPFRSPGPDKFLSAS